jgi:flagellar biosynthesis protein FlhB
VDYCFACFAVKGALVEVRWAPQGSSQNYRVGFFGIIALVGAILLYLYGSTFESSPLKMSSFVILSGVAETWFFQMFLCTWIYKFTRTMFIAVPVSAMLWSVFHIARVGGGGVAVDSIMYLVMFSMLIAGVVLSFVFVGFRFEPFNLKTFGTDLLSTAASFACIYTISSWVSVGGGFDYLFLVFLVGMPLSYLTLLFRSADGPVFAHMIVNALSGVA